MARGARRGALSHPESDRIDLLEVLHALADPTRMTIVRTLRAEPRRLCGTFAVDVAPSTLTHHFRILRESGVLRQRDEGNKRWNELRREDLDRRWPGLLDRIVDGYETDVAPACRSTGRRRLPARARR